MMPRPGAAATCRECRHSQRIGENGENICAICEGELVQVLAGPDVVPVALEVSQEQAGALVELCKRIQYSDLLRMAPQHSFTAANAMFSAVECLRVALAEAGFEG